MAKKLSALPASKSAEIDAEIAEIDRLNRFVSTSWVVDYTDMSEDTIRREVARGNLPAYRIGQRNIRYRLGDVEALAKRIA